MRLSASLLGLVSAGILLAGCSTLGFEEEAEAEPAGEREIIVLYEDKEGMNEAEKLEREMMLEQTQELLPEQETPGEIRRTGPGDLASSMSGGNVKVYSLDKEATGGPADLTPLSKGAIYASSPSVQVFPLDDEMARALSASEIVQSGAVDVVEQMPLDDTPPYGPPVAKTVALPASNKNTVRIYFEHDSSDVDKEGMEKIAGVARGHKTGEVLKVEGHASRQSSIEDPVKRKIVNLRASMNRAFSVARALIEKGVSAEFIRVSGYGDLKPSGPMDGRDAEAASRRVDISPAKGQ